MTDAQDKARGILGHDATALIAAGLEVVDAEELKLLRAIKATLESAVAVEVAVDLQPVIRNVQLTVSEILPTDSVGSVDASSIKVEDLQAVSALVAEVLAKKAMGADKGTKAELLLAVQDIFAAAEDAHTALTSVVGAIESVAPPAPVEEVPADAPAPPEEP